MDPRQAVPRDIQHGQASSGGHGHGLDGQPHELVVRQIQALYTGVREHVIRHCSELIVGEIDDPQLLQRPEGLGWHVYDVVPREEEDLDVSRVSEAVEVDLHQLVVAEIEPLQVWHVTEDTLRHVAQMVVRQVEVGQRVLHWLEVVPHYIRYVIEAEVQHLDVRLYGAADCNVSRTVSGSGFGRMQQINNLRAICAAKAQEAS